MVIPLAPQPAETRKKPLKIMLDFIPIPCCAGVLSITEGAVMRRSVADRRRAASRKGTAHGIPRENGFPEVNEKLVRCFCTFTEPPQERSISRRTAHPSRAPGDSRVLKNVAGGRISVPSDSFATFVAEWKPTAIVIDVEGAECELLPSSDLDGVRKIILETHEKIVGKERNDALLAHLADVGFKLQPSQHGRGYFTR